MFRRLLVAVALFACTLPPAAITIAAPPPMGVEAIYAEFDYYSDSTYTTLVGQGIRTCNNRFAMQWGVKSEYIQSPYSEPC